MTAMIGSVDCPPARLAATRDGLHRVAEHLLAAARYAASGEIGLVPAPGGFRTPTFGADGRFLAVDGTDLVVGDAATTRRAALTTLRAAAEFAGVTPGAPARVYRPATPLDLDGPLMIDPGAARLLAAWYQLGAQALSRLAAEVPGDQPSAAVPGPSARRCRGHPGQEDTMSGPRPWRSWAPTRPPTSPARRCSSTAA